MQFCVAGLLRSPHHSPSYPSCQVWRTSQPHRDAISTSSLCPQGGPPLRHRVVQASPAAEEAVHQPEVGQEAARAKPPEGIPNLAAGLHGLADKLLVAVLLEGTNLSVEGILVGRMDHAVPEVCHDANRATVQARAEAHARGSLAADLESLEEDPPDGQEAQLAGASLRCQARGFSILAVLLTAVACAARHPAWKSAACRAFS
mmetsp:Transcript_42105/g.73882  ORF Transcript_42105/g.73882 Transcript_42105/m.73882 type:complete len:203 (+) Transcript_42105:1450-2058(+)